jgi:alanine racemase
MAGDDNISFTKAQFDGLMYMIDELSKRGVTFNIRHCANSAGIMDFPEYQLDMVRSGIITYGLYPSDELDASHIDIKPAMELKSHVIHIKEINKGDSIGYGGTYVADDVRKIATIPVGYGDGYLRSLSNKGIVLIRGKRAPIVGRVCMDQFMVDVTDIPDIKIKDEVTLFGRDGDEFLPVDEVANLAGSFNYEFCCDVGLRIPRIYHVNGREDVVISYIDEL